jgi:hypothetical protein
MMFPTERGEGRKKEVEEREKWKERRKEEED